MLSLRGTSMRWAPIQVISAISENYGWNEDEGPDLVLCIRPEKSQVASVHVHTDQ